MERVCHIPLQAGIPLWIQSRGTPVLARSASRKMVFPQEESLIDSSAEGLHFRTLRQEFLTRESFFARYPAKTRESLWNYHILIQHVADE